MEKATLHSIYEVPHRVDEEDNTILISALTDMSFATYETGWAVGSGQVLLTRDGGQSWLNQFDPQLRQFGISPWRARAVDANTCWLIGLLNAGDVRCCYTRDAGESWEPKKFQPKFFPNDVFFDGSKRGWIVGDDGDYHSGRGRMLFITSDAGDAWDQVDLGVVGRPERIRFLEDGRRGWLIERRLTASGEPVSRLYSSSNGGLQWEPVVHFERGVSELCLLDAQTVFVAGDDGFVSRTTDGGQTWERLNTQCRGFINSIQFYDKRLGLLMSDFGVLLLTENGGESWRRISDSKKLGSLVAAVFLSETRIVVAGIRGIYSLKL